MTAGLLERLVTISRDHSGKLYEREAKALRALRSEVGNEVYEIVLIGKLLDAIEELASKRETEVRADS